MPLWNETKPLNLSRSKKPKWTFATYIEMPSERDDGLWYTALLFRNEDRTVFGVKEHLGDELSGEDYRATARRILNDKEFRDSLISDSADLRKMWRRH